MSLFNQTILLVFHCPQDRCSIPTLHCNSHLLGCVFIGILLLGCPLHSTSHLLKNLSCFWSEWTIRLDSVGYKEEESRWLHGLRDFVHVCLCCHCSYLCHRCMNFGCWKSVAMGIPYHEATTCPYGGHTVRSLPIWAQPACWLKSRRNLCWKQWTVDDFIHLTMSRVPTLAPLAAQTIGGTLVDILTTMGTNVWQTQCAS